MHELVLKFTLGIVNSVPAIYFLLWSFPLKYRWQLFSSLQFNAW